MNLFPCWKASAFAQAFQRSLKAATAFDDEVVEVYLAAQCRAPQTIE